MTVDLTAAYQRGTSKAYAAGMESDAHWQGLREVEAAVREQIAVEIEAAGYNARWRLAARIARGDSRP